MRAVVADGPPAVLDDALVLCEQRFVVAAESNTRLCVVSPHADALTIAHQLAALGMLIGVGSVGPVAEAPNSYRTAGLALAQATPASAVVQWENVVQLGPLGFMNRDDARRFAASFLGDLDPDQLMLLRCFLRHHGSRIRVAEELGVHRNTVRNRLDEVAAQLPGSLDDPQTRASAWIALQCLVPDLPEGD
jgi:purine catabolism regulator